MIIIILDFISIAATDVLVAIYSNCYNVDWC